MYAAPRGASDLPDQVGSLSVLLWQLDYPRKVKRFRSRSDSCSISRRLCPSIAALDRKVQQASSFASARHLCCQAA
jgi:hypothetical protein